MNIGRVDLEGRSHKGSLRDQSIAPGQTSGGQIANVVIPVDNGNIVFVEGGPGAIFSSSPGQVANDNCKPFGDCRPVNVEHRILQRGPVRSRVV